MTFESLVATAPDIIKQKLEQLKFLKERPDYHPEPSTYHHIRIVTNRLIAKGYSIELILSGILHDICKFDCVKENTQTGYPTSPEHGKWSARFIQNDIYTINWIEQIHKADIDRVMDICMYHMRIQQYPYMKPNKKMEMEQLDCFDDLLLFTACDDMLSTEYNLIDVLPICIAAKPGEGGTCYVCKMGDDGYEITEKEFSLYRGTMRYTQSVDCPDDIYIAYREINPSI